jgi:magnesium transporter
MFPSDEHLSNSVLTIARKDVTAFHFDMTIRQALDKIREQGIGEKIVYFYVVDKDERLVGVIPTRKLLSRPVESRLDEIMISRVLTLPRTSTILQACEFFSSNKLLACPVVDEHHHIMGIVDLGMFANEVINLEERRHLNDVFETIGLRLSGVQNASPLRAFRFRFPWLFLTIISGTACAILAGCFETTVAKTLILAFFLTLVLGLGESVSMQTMAVTIQAFRTLARPSWPLYLKTLRREIAAAVILGLTCGTTVGAIIYIWHQTPRPAFAVGLSIVLALLSACFFGLTVPTILHRFKLDLRIAAGPLTLAITDLFTLLFYFSTASWLL